MSTLAPGILIAAPPMSDANFERSVVLLASHDEDGAFGWVINGPTVLTVGELLEQSNLDPGDKLASRFMKTQVSQGGPVSPEQVWLVYPAKEKLEGVEGQMEIAPGVFATASRQFLEKIAEGFEVPHLRAFAGYAGWGAGQLETEIRDGGWLPGKVSPDLLFDDQMADAWQRAFALQGISPMSFASRTVGSA